MMKFWEHLESNLGQLGPETSMLTLGAVHTLLAINVTLDLRFKLALKVLIL